LPSYSAKLGSNWRCYFREEKSWTIKDIQ
jgi:hypothetical protein